MTYFTGHLYMLIFFNVKRKKRLHHLNSKYIVTCGYIYEICDYHILIRTMYFIIFLFELDGKNYYHSVNLIFQQHS